MLVTYAIRAGIWRIGECLLPGLSAGRTPIVARTALPGTAIRPGVA